MSQVAIPGVDGDLSGELRRPEGTTPAPAVIVLSEIDGFCPGTVAAAQHLADAGYVALALDLYTPYGGTPPLRGREDTMAWLARLNERRQLSDLAMALSWLKSVPGVDPDRLAVLGFSIGGRFSMMMTTEPHGLRAAVAMYSRPWPSEAIAQTALAPGKHVALFGQPVCAIFGADDEMIPLTMVEEFREELERYPALGHELHVLPGRHFFVNESRPRRYVPESAEKAWGFALEFLATHMAQPSE